jgi:toxin YoeB
MSAERRKVFETVFQPEFREDLLYWVGQDRKTAEKILRLVEEISRTPFSGAGKPEPLKHFGPDVWSRRITLEHRLVYRVSGSRVDFLQCRYHY